MKHVTCIFIRTILRLQGEVMRERELLTFTEEPIKTVTFSLLLENVLQTIVSKRVPGAVSLRLKRKLVSLTTDR